MVICRRKYYYNTKLSRKQYDKFYDRDIHECLYKRMSHRMDICGICYFYTNMAPGIERRIPIKMTIRDN